jgi:hypothetical protein
MKRSSRHTAIILLTVLLSANCFTNPEEAKKLDELRRIAADTPIYTDFRQIDSNYMMKSTVVDLGFFYQSTASFDEVKAFYVKGLSAKGWSSSEEQNLSDDNRELTFVKGPYSIVVEYDSASRQQWNYAITYAWERP